MEELEIKKLLENITETPSPRCWQAIEAQLSVGLSSAAAAQQAVNATSRHSLFHLSSIATKIIVATSAAAAIATGITLAVLHSASPSISDNSTPPASTAILPDSTQEDTLIPSIQDAPAATASIAPSQISTQSEMTADKVSTHSGTPNSAPTTQPVPSVAIPKPSTSTPQKSDTPAPQSHAKSSVAPDNQASATKPNHSQPSPQIQETINHDPVLVEKENLDIDFTPPVTIEIPNVITPNGDGYNDFFVIKGIENCDNNRLIIRSRNGNIVFQSAHYQNNWDALKIPAGTYYYQFYYTIHGIDETRAGTLVIMKE